MEKIIFIENLLDFSAMHAASEHNRITNLVNLLILELSRNYIEQGTKFFLPRETLLLNLFPAFQVKCISDDERLNSNVK